MTKKFYRKEYSVEKILKSRYNSKGGKEYLIQWEGFPSNQSTWEPIQNLNKVRTMVDDFERRNRRRKNQIKQVKPMYCISSDSDDEEGESDSQRNYRMTRAARAERKVLTKKSGVFKDSKSSSNRIGSKKSVLEQYQEIVDSSDSSDESFNEKNANVSEDSSNESPPIIRQRKAVNVPKQPFEIRSVKGNKYGSLTSKDIPSKIVGGKPSGSDIMFMVKWKPRRDGSVPKPTFISKTELRKNYKDLLMDYYESKLKFYQKDGLEFKAK